MRLQAAATGRPLELGALGMEEGGEEEPAFSAMGQAGDEPKLVAVTDSEPGVWGTRAQTAGSMVEEEHSPGEGITGASTAQEAGSRERVPDYLVPRYGAPVEQQPAWLRREWKRRMGVVVNPGAQHREGLGSGGSGRETSQR